MELGTNPEKKDGSKSFLQHAVRRELKGTTELSSRTSYEFMLGFRGPCRVSLPGKRMNLIL